MLAEPSSLARNTSYFTMSLVVQKVISFLYFTFLARLLGPELIGKYVFALSLTTVFSVLLDLGLANVLTREVAREPKSANKYLRLVLGYKIAAMIFVVGLLALFLELANYPQITRQLVYIASLVMIADSFTLTAYSTIRGFHNLSWESIGAVLMQLVVATGGLVVSMFTNDLRWLMTALVVAALSNLVFSMWQLHFRYSLSLMPLYNWLEYKVLANLVWPFALAAIMTRLYGYLDSVLLSLLSGDMAVGLYSVAYKITFALQFIPSAFSASLYPGFSSYWGSAPDKLASTFMRGVIYLTAISVPISLGIIAVAPEVINIIYPAFKQAVLPLQILIFSLIFLFITFPIGALLPACNKQLRQTGNLTMAAASNLLLNVFLIPIYGPVGAATASLLSTIVLLVSGWLVARKLINIDGHMLIRRLLKILLSGLLMLIFTLLFKSKVNIFILMPISAVLYAVVLVILGGVTKQEIGQLWRLIFIKPISL